MATTCDDSCTSDMWLNHSKFQVWILHHTASAVEAVLSTLYNTKSMKRWYSVHSSPDLTKTV